MNYPESNQPAWYCVHTRSRHEDKVFQRLSDKGISAFLPKMETWSKRKDRRKKILKALFAGYLFVYEILTAQRGLDILKTPGVVKILGNEDGPQPVPEVQIESIRKNSKWTCGCIPISLLEGRAAGPSRRWPTQRM
jgi:transcriptional antiterminator NusG